MSFTTIIWFIFVFCVIVVSHEFGHFIVAKMNGIHVEEFTIGMGPKLIGFHKNGTFYVLRLLPLGGACIFDGTELEIKDKEKEEDTATEAETNEEIESDKVGVKFNEASVWARIASVLAGPFANFIIAYLLAIVIVWFTGSDIPEIHNLLEGYPAAEAGLQEGDIIKKIGNTKVMTAREIYVNTFINKSGKPMEVEYERDGVRYTTVIVPKYSEEDDRYLMGLSGYGTYVEGNNIHVFEYAYHEVRYCLVATVKSLGMLFAGNGSKDDLAGPVGMAHIIDDVRKEAEPYGFGLVLINMMNIAMLLSVNLGIMNLLPIPAIDGGRLIFLIVEAVRGKPIEPQKEGIVHLIGFVLLFALMIFVMYNDIMKWVK